MMRGGVAAFALLVFMAAPASAQPGGAASMERSADEAARWSEQLGAALTAATEGFEELNQKVQALTGAGLSRERMAEAGPGLRRLLEQNRDNVRRSNAMLEALPPYPSGLPTDVPAGQLVADARNQNGRLLELLDQYDTVFVAMAKGDSAGLNRALPRMMEGVFALLEQQRLVFRNRQASVPVTNSSHQALGIAVQIYRAMIAVARRGLAAREGDGAGAATAAAALGKELRLVAAETRALAAAGRGNLKRELAEFESLRKQSKQGPETRLAERAIAVTAAEEKSFEIADRLAAFAESNAALTGAQLRQSGARELLAPLTQLESDFMDSSLEQVGLTTDAPK
jgi:hypothetical protein